MEEKSNEIKKLKAGGELQEQVIIKKVTEPEAFQVYLEMGVERSIPKLQQLFSGRSVSLRTLWEWSRRNNWVVRADEWDRLRHEEIYKLALKNAIKVKSDVLDICRAVIGTFVMELKGEKFEITTQEINKDGKVKTKKKEYLRRFHPLFEDVKIAYDIIKQELGEGLSEWESKKSINLLQVIQQIYFEADKLRKQKEEDARNQSW